MFMRIGWHGVRNMVIYPEEQFPDHDQEWMRRLFPNITEEQYLLTSKRTDLYNCAAWALDIDDMWLDPSGQKYTWWPENIARDTSVSTYVELYKSYGYEICDNPSQEDGYQKIALHIQAGYVKHVSRQLRDTTWTSKLGGGYDASHDFDALKGGDYGAPEVILRRPL